MRTKIDNFFAKKGIDVYYNSLGATELLIKSFVSNYKEDIDKTSFKISSNIKNVIYDKIFPITVRHKKTGFESVKNLDHTFRDNIKKFIKEPQFSPLLLIENQQCDNKLNYKQELIKFVKTLKNPLIYFSGGIDSELLLKACISAEINFNVVIFEWLNNKGELLNTYELSYAYKICKQHSIFPIIKQINIEKLWEDKTFKEFSIDIQIQSPQLVTHAYMIDIMSKDYTNSTHMFGGEVRFKTNHLLDDGTTANLVFLDKLNPGYNGQSYSAADDGGGFGTYCECTLSYGTTGIFLPIEGSWIINGTNNLQGSPVIGQWTTTPAVDYEFRITNVVGTISGATPNGPTDWTPMNRPGFTFICGSSATSSGTTVYDSNQFSIQVRVSGEASPIQDSTITLAATAFN